jgi:hypothetical protein
MNIKWMAFIFLFFTTSVFSQNIKQTININTKLQKLRGKPSWLIIIRDMESGKTLPYLYDIREKDNYWIAFSTERGYRVTASVIKFNTGATIRNFCRLESGVIAGKSMRVMLTGDLTPNLNGSKCRVNRFKDVPMTNIQE